MRIEAPAPGVVPGLRRLWKTAFGDTDAFLDAFFSTAFHPGRCLCAMEGDTPVGALYWFDISCDGQPMAYLYALATDPEFRGRGIAHALMDHIHTLLARAGYAGAILVPGSESLFSLYAGMGYRVCSSVSRITAERGESSVPLRPLTPGEYGEARRRLLPAGGVIQEGVCLDFLQAQGALLAGDGFLASLRREDDRLIAMELLGDTEQAAGIVAALDAREGVFQIPGKEIPYAMFLPLQAGAAAPRYFGLAFD